MLRMPLLHIYRMCLVILPLTLDDLEGLGYTPAYRLHILLHLFIFFYELKMTLAHKDILLQITHRDRGPVDSRDIIRFTTYHYIIRVFNGLFRIDEFPF